LPLDGQFRWIVFIEFFGQLTMVGYEDFLIGSASLFVFAILINIYKPR